MIGDKLFFNNTTTTGDSEYLINNKANVLSLQVFGEATSFSISVLGLIDIDSDDFVPLTGINLSDFSLASNISKNGIYEYDISGIRLIKLNLASTNANISVKGVTKE